MKPTKLLPVTATVATALCVAGLAITWFSPGWWPLVLSGIMLGLVGAPSSAWWDSRPRPVPPARRARHPHGDAPAGYCPICGQHDPAGLDRDGCHGLCVEWLGYVPRDPIGDVTTTEAAAALNMMSGTPYRYPTRGGYESGKLTIDQLPPIPAWMIQKPMPPSGPGAASPPAQ